MYIKKLKMKMNLNKEQRENVEQTWEIMRKKLDGGDRWWMGGERRKKCWDKTGLIRTNVENCWERSFWTRFVSLGLLKFNYKIS